MKRPFEYHEMTVRLSLEGIFEEETFYTWILDETAVRKIDGWAKPRLNGSMDVFFAGGVNTIMDMLRLFAENDVPVELSKVEERPVRGDEPIWQGFHYLPMA